MATQIKKDLSLLKALEYLVKNQYGYLDDLQENPDFNNELINEFCLMSFMRLGWTKNKQTWGVTQFGRQYYSVVR